MVYSTVKYNSIDIFIERFIESQCDSWAVLCKASSWTRLYRWLHSNTENSKTPWSCEKDKTQCTHTVTQSKSKQRGYKWCHGSDGLPRVLSLGHLAATVNDTNDMWRWIRATSALGSIDGSVVWCRHVLHG